MWKMEKELKNIEDVMEGTFFNQRKGKFFFWLTFLAFATRLSYLDNLPGTTWDEVHFGKFSSQYINRTFHHDVHPPLGKIILAGAAYASGYRGNFNFTISQYYDPNVINHVLLRMPMAIMGALLVPLTFLTVFELTNSVGASAVAAICVLSDTHIHRITTLYLLDAPLLLAICFSVFASIKFWNQREWSRQWWAWLFLTGGGLGVVVSIKYIGVFTVVFVGLHTAFQLYSIIATPNRPISHLIPHTLVRVVGLIIFPIMIYLSSFVLHFTILTQTNPNQGGWIHSRFYAGFNNSDFGNREFSQYVTYGSKLTLQSSHPMVGYLDSWYDLFPSEFAAPCQIVSARPMKQENGHIWHIKKVQIETGSVDDGINPLEPPKVVRNGDHIMLTHEETTRSLRAHGYRAAITKRLLQVCGYGDKGAGGPSETWQILIPDLPIGEPLKTFVHDFRLRNYAANCYLKSSTVKIPDSWGSDNMKEVACTRNPKHPNLDWHVHWIETDKWLGSTTAEKHTMNMWEMIVHQHDAMFTLNSVLIKDDNSDNEPITANRPPWSWPLAYQGQLMAAYSANRVEDEHNIFAVGMFSPFVCYVNLLCLFLSIILYVTHFYQQTRHPDEPEHTKCHRYNTIVSLTWVLLCWAFHYLPFWTMSRVLYIHHYCPAFIYSCMVSGIIINYYCKRWADVIVLRHQLKNVYTFLLATCMTSILLSYVLLYPIATYVENEVFMTSPRLNTILQLLNFGQQWYEFGFADHDWASFHLLTKWDELEENNFNNPHINTTLYYTVEDLNNTRPQSAFPQPVSVFRNESM